MRHILLSTLLIAPLLALPACTRQEGNDNVLHAGNRSEVQDLDPHLVSGIAEFRALGALFEGLVSLDMEDLEPVPGAARAWEVSPDGLRYVFEMQPEGRWSNGEPVTAHDFVYAWQRMLTPTLAAEYAYMLHCLKNGRAYNDGEITDFSQVGVRAEDDYTLVVELEHPTPYFLSMQIHFAWFPVHQGTIEAHGALDQRGSPWTRPGNHVGNGPYQLADWRPDDVLRTGRNPYYWDAENVRLDGVNFYPISNEQQEERRFRRGALQLTYAIPMHRIEHYQANQPEVLVLAPYFQTYFYRFNTTRPPFDDQRVRQAFGMAIEREELVGNVLKGEEEAAFFLTPPDTVGYTSRAQVTTDVARARELLAEAGYPNGEGLPTVEVLYSASETDKIITEALQRMWRENLGVETTLLSQDYKVYLDSMSALNFDVIRSTWLGDVYDPVNFLECFLTDGGNNRTGWGSAEFDRLIEASYHEVDPAQRHEYLHQAEAILLEEAPITPVFFQTQKYLKAADLLGLTPNFQGFIRWQDLYFDRPAGTEAE